MYEAKRDEAIKYHRQHYMGNREEAVKYSLHWNKKNKDKVKIYKREYNRRLKLKCMQHYSKGEEVICSWDGCGINDIDVLVIDHINGGGNKHRALLSKGRGGGNSFYKWLVDNDYPSGFQVLCANHNLKKEIIRKREYVN